MRSLRAGLRAALGCAVALLIALEARPAGAQVCESEDPDSRVTAGGHCIAFSVLRGAQATPPRALVAVLHGDLSGGAPADYHRRFAERLVQALPQVAAAALIRPGYADSAGRASSGSNYGRRDHYRAPVIDAMADATRRIAAGLGTPRVVLLGHSGGAAISGVMIGRHPGIASGAVLVACPCDLRAWRIDRGGAPWTNSLSPSEWIAGVPASLRVVALTGAADDNTRPFLASNYAASLAARGIGATFVEVAGAGHNSVMDDAAVVDAVRRLALQ